MLRGLGRNLTEATIATLINSYDANGSGKLDFPTFYRLMTQESPMPGPCHEKQVLADFHVFDMYRDGQWIGVLRPQQQGRGLVWVVGPQMHLNSPLTFVSPSSSLPPLFSFFLGFIPVVDLVHLLRNLGEPLTRDDVDHLLQEIYIDGDNKVNIKDLVQHMFRTSAPNPE